MKTPTSERIALWNELNSATSKRCNANEEVVRLQAKIEKLIACGKRQRAIEEDIKAQLKAVGVKGRIVGTWKKEGAVT